jgi:threonine synthase
LATSSRAAANARRSASGAEGRRAAGIAGLIKYKKAGKLPKGKKIVITVTGHGLKDISWALEKFAKPKVVKVNAAVAAKALGLK